MNGAKKAELVGKRRRVVPKGSSLSRCDDRSLHVAVVDPRPQDYADLLDEFATGGASCHFLPLARDALRLARTHGADLWVVHVSLPDTPGTELCAMLKACRPETTVYVVADEQQMDEEQEAWNCGANLFVCKPVRTEWFDVWLDRSVRFRSSSRQSV
jgi:DNA-binding response OmpR family regulator